MNEALLIGGRFTALREIGRGGMGTVYEGTDTFSGAPVAIKILRPEVLTYAPDMFQRFIREGEALRLLNHPNIVQVLAVAHDRQPPAIVMDYVGGGTLETLLSDTPQLPLTQVFQIGLGIADALARTHHLNIIHRDIKPSNILLSANGDPCLTDFGTALVGDGHKITATGIVMGTFAYLSPEACNGEALDARADIWSFGVVLYQMLAGRCPFDATLPLAGLLTAILTQTPPPLASLRPDAPPDLVALIERMLEKDRNQRLSSARLVGAALEAIKRQEPVQLGPVPLSDTAEVVLPIPRHNLPLQTTPFVGREEEVLELSRLLREASCRLITLSGIGGIGKTRLSLAVAENLLQYFPDGIFFVPLTPLENADQIAPAIAALLGLHLDGMVTPAARLLTFLESKRLLLVMDNFEHLVEGATLVGDILAHAPAVKIIATSREALNLREEWNRPLRGMPVPQNPSEIGELAPFSAVRLFIERARLVRANFNFEKEKAGVIEICQLVEGAPLAIELAASWLRMMSAAEIAAEIRQNLDFLMTTRRNIPERHRSLRAVFEYSWKLLNAQEKAALPPLAIFRGGFTRQAALAIADASLPMLSALVDKSLLSTDAAGRYDLHDLVRQYAYEKLLESSDVGEIEARHAEYYLTFLQQQSTAIFSAAQNDTLNLIATELQNVRAAWAWAVERHDFETINRAYHTLYMYYRIRRFTDGVAAFESAAQALEDYAQSAFEKRVFGALIARYAWFTLRLHGWKAALHVYVRSYRILRDFPECEELIFVGTFLGHIRAAEALTDSSLDDIPDGETLLQEALHLARQKGKPADIATALYFLGSVHSNTARTAEALTCYQEGLAIGEKTGNPEEIGDISHNLGWLYFANLKDYGQARFYFERALHAYKSINDNVGCASVLSGFSFLLRKEGELVTSRHYLQQSIEISRSIGMHVGSAYRLLNNALNFLYDGSFDDAQEYARLALEEFTQMNHHIGRGEASSTLGNILLWKKDLAAAREHLLMALQSGEEDKTAWYYILAQTGLGHLELLNGNLSQACRYQIEALQVIASRPELERTQDMFVPLYTLRNAVVLLQSLNQPLIALRVVSYILDVPALSDWGRADLEPRRAALLAALSTEQVAQVHGETHTFSSMISDALEAVRNGAFLS